MPTFDTNSGRRMPSDGTWAHTADTAVSLKAKPLLSRPIIQGRVEAASRVAICIESFCKDKAGQRRKVGSGTGFIHQRYGRDFLITNWHVVTGRKPDAAGELLDGYPDSPSDLEIYIPPKDRPKEFLPIGPIELYRDGKAQWLETRFKGQSADRRIDVVALPGVFASSALIVRIEEFTEFENQWLHCRIPVRDQTGESISDMEARVSCFRAIDSHRRHAEVLHRLTGTARNVWIASFHDRSRYGSIGKNASAAKGSIHTWLRVKRSDAD